MKVADYTDGELRLLVRQERAQLAAEWNDLTFEERRIFKRKGEITRRLAELDKADDILEGF